MRSPRLLGHSELLSVSVFKCDIPSSEPHKIELILQVCVLYPFSFHLLELYVWDSSPDPFHKQMVIHALSLFRSKEL